jgi:hypothetical protein
MECNLCNSMKTLQELCGSDFWKEIGRGILGKQRNHMKNRIFDAGGRSEGKFGVMKEKLSDQTFYRTQKCD